MIWNVECSEADRLVISDKQTSDISLPQSGYNVMLVASAVLVA